MILLLTQYCSGDKIEKNMGSKCRTYGEVHTGFWWENLTERDRFEYASVDGRMILRWIYRKCD
jgi:hypothetical protein